MSWKGRGYQDEHTQHEKNAAKRNLWTNDEAGSSSEVGVDMRGLLPNALPPKGLASLA